MGKTRGKRFGSLRPTPTGMNADGDAELEASAQACENTPSTISNIIEKLQAPGTEERACGCKILASIVSQPSAIGHLLNVNAIKIAAPLFLDSCLDVRKSAIGALKNMSVYGQEDVCDVMVAQDVLTPLVAVIKEYGDNWIPPKEATKYDTAAEVLVEAVELLANLCESSATAVHWFNKENLLLLLLPVLKVETYGYPLSNVVARCLHVVSENNADVSSVCSRPDVLAEIQRAISLKHPSMDSVLNRTLMTGILLNIPDVDLSHHYQNIVCSMVDALDKGLASAIESALEGQQQTEEDMNYDPELTWPTVDKLLTAQGVSLELIANLCCSTDDEWEDDTEGSEDSSIADAQDDVDMAADGSDSLCLSSELNSAFLEQNILAKIMKVALPFDPELTKRLESTQCGKATLTKLLQLRQRALLCLSNLVEAVDEGFLSQSMSLTEMWMQLFELFHMEKDEDMKWAITCALRAIIQRLAAHQPTSSCDISDTDLDFMIGVAAESKNREVQINILRILSTLGCLMSLQNQLNELFKKIGTILLEVASNNSDVVIVSEALDSLFDVFKEDHTDAIAKEISLVEKLVALQPYFKAKISTQRKKLGDNAGMVMMAKTNLQGFIKYKRSQR